MFHGPDEPNHPWVHVPGWSWPTPILREVPNARAVASPVPPDAKFLPGQVEQALAASLLSPPGELLPLHTPIPREPPLVGAWATIQAKENLTGPASRSPPGFPCWQVKQSEDTARGPHTQQPNCWAAIFHNPIYEGWEQSRRTGLTIWRCTVRSFLFTTTSESTVCTYVPLRWEKFKLCVQGEGTIRQSFNTHDYR